MTFIWIPHNLLRTFSWLSGLCQDFLMNFPQIFQEFLITFSWLSYNFLTTFSWISYNFFKTISWLLHLFLMNLSRFSYDVWMTFSWISYSTTRKGMYQIWYQCPIPQTWPSWQHWVILNEGRSPKFNITSVLSKVGFGVWDTENILQPVKITHYTTAWPFIER